MNFTTSATKVLVVIESLPKSEEGARAGLSTRIEQDSNFGVQDSTKGIEQPTMRVDLLAVLLLQAENELHRRQTRGSIGRRSDELLVGCYGKLTGVLEDVSNSLLSINILLDDTILEDTNSGEDIQSVLVSLFNTVENQTDNDLLPGRSTLVPESGLFEVDNISDVLHNTVECSGEQDLVFVVVGDGNEQLSVSVVHSRSQIVTVLQSEVVGIAGRGGVSHLHELFVAALDIAVLGLNGVLDGAGNWVVNAENGALNKLDFSGVESLQTTTSRGCRLLLSLNPAVFRIEGGGWSALSIAVASVRTKLSKACSIVTKTRSQRREL